MEELVGRVKRFSVEEAGETLADTGRGMSAGERSCERVKGTFRSDEMSMTCSGWKISLTKAIIDIGQ